MRNFFFILKSLCGGKSANTPPSEFSYASHGITPAFLKPLALVLLFVLGSVNVWGETIFLETFGSTNANTAFASYTGFSATTSMFSTSGTVQSHYSGVGSVGKNNLNGVNLSSGYTDASGLSGAYHGGTANSTATILQISNIDISNYTSLRLSFGALGGSTSHKINVTYKIDNGTETSLIENGAITNAEWTLLSENITGTGSSLTLYFKHTPTKNWTIRLDDITITGEANNTPAKTTLATPTGMSSGEPGVNGTTLSWNVVEHADGYALTIGTNDPITTGFTTNNDVVSYTLAGLDAETTYTWKVKATTSDTEHYSNSADCAVQNFTTADDPNYMKVTYDFTNTSNYPDGFPATSSPAHTTTTATEYEFGGNTLKLYVPNNFYRDGSHLFFGQTAVSNSIPTGAYIEFPAIPGYKLTKVVLHENSNAANGAYLNIFSTAGEAMSTAVLSTNVKDKDATFVLNNPDYNTAYRITAATASKNLRFDRLVLTYAPKPAVSGISIKTAPTKTTYNAKESFEPSGLVLTVNYEGGTSEDVVYDNTTASDFSFMPATNAELDATHTSVTVTYGGKTANQAITVNRIATSLLWSANSFAVNIGAASPLFPTLTTTPDNLAGVTYSSTDENVALIDENTGEIVLGDEPGSTTITASFEQTNVYAAASPASYTLSLQAANTPSLETDPSSLDFGVVAVNDNKPLQFTLSGEHLTADASLVITGDDMFSVVPSVAKDGDGNIIENVTVTYAPTEDGSHSATLTISSTGATPVEVALSGEAKARRTVKWYKGNADEITGNDLGSATTSVLDGDAITAMPSAPASCDVSISFVGWTDAIYAKNDNAPTKLYISAAEFPAVSGSNATYYAVWAEQGAAQESSLTQGVNTSGLISNAGWTNNGAGTYSNHGLKFDTQGDFITSADISSENLNSVIVKFKAGANTSTGSVFTITSHDADGNVIDTKSCTPATNFDNQNDYSYPLTGSSTIKYVKIVLSNRTVNVGMEYCELFKSVATYEGYTTNCVAPVVITDPTFDVAGGTYNVAKTVKVNNYNSNYYYFYTLDGTTPAADANLQPTGTAVAYNHTTGIAINESCTLKVIAYDADANTSDVTSATYTLNLPLTLAQFVAQKPTTDKEIDLTDAIVLGAQGKFIYVQQGEAAMALYNNTPASWVKGNKVTGIITGKYTGNYNVPEMQVSSFGTATATGAFDMPTPLEITDDNAGETLVESNMFRYAEIKNVTFGVDENEFTIVNTTGDYYYYYEDELSIMTGKILPESTVTCDVKGIIYPYKSSGTFYYDQLAPIALSDISTKNAVSTLPTITPAGSTDSENPTEVTYLSNVTVTAAENTVVALTVNGEEAESPVQIEGDVTMVVTASRDFYADNTATYYYKPSAYPKTITKVSTNGTMTVKVGENEVSSALPNATVEVTISNVEKHYSLNSVTVKDADNGDVTVSENEGVYSFTMPNKDVTITANYDNTTAYCALTVIVNGVPQAPVNIVREDEYDLSEIATPADQNGYEFVGWAESEQAEDVETTIETIDSYTPGAAETSKTLYAVFSRVDNTSPNVGKYIKVTADLGTAWAGDYLIAYSNAIFADGRTGGETGMGKANQKVVPGDKLNGNVVDGTWGDTYNVTLEEISAGSNTYLLKTKDGKYNYYTSNSSNGLSANATRATAANYPISITFTSASDVKLKLGGNATGSVFRYNAQSSMFRFYQNCGQSAVYLYKKFTAPTYYTTAPAAVYAVSYALGGGAWAENEGCDGANVKAGKTFDICESVPVRDHYKFNGWKVGDNTASGTITIDAATVITANWVPKVESNITYNAGTGTGSDAVVENNEEGAEIVLPSAADKSLNKTGFDFVGWLYNGNLYKAGQTFEMPSSAVTFVAQWKKQNITKMTLVTNANQLVNGSQVIFVNQEDAAIAGNSDKETDTYMVSEIVSFNEDKSVVTSTGNGIVMTLVQVEGGWAFKYNNKYLAPYSGNRMAWYSNATAWEITFDGVNAKIEKDSYAMRYNKASNAKRFAAYSLTGVEPIQLYASLTAITDTENPVAISDLGYVEGDVIVVNSGVQLTMNEPSAPASITVKDGATVTISAATEADNLIVENGGKVTVSSSTTVNDLFIGSTMASGKSGQIDGATNINFEAVGDVYFDLTLGANGTSAQWHAFTVPFPVDALNGVYDLDGNKLTNEVNYAIMDYHGDIRANGDYGWKKYRGILQPGTFYLMTVDGDRTTYRFKKVAGADIVATNSISYTAYNGGGEDSDKGWNGIGNPTLFYGQININVQVLNPNSYTYEVKMANSTNFVVGTPFFYQATTTSTISMGAVSGSAFYAPKRQAENEIKDVEISFGNEEFKDHLYISAREEATNNYEIGKDLAKMMMTSTPSVAQIYGKAYNTNLCMIDAPLVNGQATYKFTLYAPVAGEYTITAPNMENVDIYLTKDDAIIWNISEDGYTLDMQQGFTTGYGLLLQVKAPEIATDIDNLSGNASCVQKVVIDDHVYILRGEKMYDTTGKIVK